LRHSTNEKTLVNFIIGGALGLAVAAYYGAKRYVKRKFSDTGESSLGSQPNDRKSEEIAQPRKAPEKDWGQRLAEIARGGGRGQNRAALKPARAGRSSLAFGR
jgi:hypothetical protein